MRDLFVLLLSSSLLLAPTATTAQEPAPQSAWHAFWQSVKLDWHRNNAYPEPFQSVDRQATWAAWMPYIAKGWQLQTTLGDFDFDPQSQALTAAGEAKLRWIATQAPQQRRTVYVLRGTTPEVTEQRVDAVQQRVAQMLPSGPLPPVVRSDVAPRRSTGGYLVEVWKKATASIPTPTLPTSSDTGSE